MDWNSLLSDDSRLLFTRYTERYFPDADDLVRYLGDFARAHDLHVEYDTPVARVTLEYGPGWRGKAKVCTRWSCAPMRSVCSLPSIT